MNSKNGYVAKGLKFKLGKYDVRIWKYGLEYGDGMRGRVYFFWWAPKPDCFK